MGRAPCCDKNGLKKGPWTPEEDHKLVQYIQAHGPGNWRSLPKNAGLERCGKSCRLRWTNYLRPDIKRGRFSFEEEEAIIQLHSILGNKWSAIAARLPGRTDNEIKNYWNTHIRKRLLRMGIDPVTHSPRLDLLDLSSILTSSLCSTTPLFNVSSLMAMASQPLVNPEFLKLATTLFALKHDNPEFFRQNLQENHLFNPQMQNQNIVPTLQQDGQFQTQIQDQSVPSCTTTSNNVACTTTTTSSLDQTQFMQANVEPNYNMYGSSNPTICDQLENSSFQSLNNECNHNFNGFDSVKSSPLSGATPLNSPSTFINNSCSTEDERESYCSSLLKFEIPESFDISEFM